jgi:hypothetical protein
MSALTAHLHALWASAVFPSIGRESSGPTIFIVGAVSMPKIKPVPSELAEAANYFPVARRPPRSHFWPKRNQQQRAFDALARKVALQLLAEVSMLNEPRFWPQVLSYARAMVLRERALLHVTELSSLLNDEDAPRDALALYLRLDERVTAISRELGITPVTGKMLAKNSDLAAACVLLDKHDDDAGDNDGD